jgi:rare lipoprotein A
MQVEGAKENPKVGKIASNSNNQEPDAVWRASSLAARLNQLARNNIDPNSITVKWEKGDRYIIQANGEDLVNINAETILPDTTSDFSRDALQATNRLRRLLGNAPPLKKSQANPNQNPPCCLWAQFKCGSAAGLPGTAQALTATSAPAASVLTKMI